MTTTVTIAPVRKSITVKAAPARAFDAFTREIAAWWPRTHHVGKADMRSATIEPRQGGRWYETGEDGSESDWGKVLVWDPPGRVVLSWDLDAQFQRNPNRSSEVEIRFLAEGAGTRVELEHSNLERLGGEDGAILRQRVDAPNGWGAILAQYATHAAN
ncbi:MAG TPA: SRPBCC family protein [Stellaceae bacterium]|nr:SRPBCC family protein [Stellaceae bacterium]